MLSGLKTAQDSRSQFWFCVLSANTQREISNNLTREVKAHKVDVTRLRGPAHYRVNFEHTVTSSISEASASRENTIFFSRFPAPTEFERLVSISVTARLPGKRVQLRWLGFVRRIPHKLASPYSGRTVCCSRSVVYVKKIISCKGVVYTHARFRGWRENEFEVCGRRVVGMFNADVGV